MELDFYFFLSALTINLVLICMMTQAHLLLKIENILGRESRQTVDVSVLT